MIQQTPTSFIGRLVKDLDNNHSQVYITIALSFYLIPVVLISSLFISASIDSEYDTAYIALFWVAIVVLPLMLTFGVFVVYRATYSARNTYSPDSALPDFPITQEAEQWNMVISKALDWHRFLMPLCLLNMFITLISGFLLYTDISTAVQDSSFIEANDPAVVADSSSINDIYFGYYDVKLVYGNFGVPIPGSVFYMGLLGFMVHFLEMSRRRYVSRNLVPRFYLMSAFRLLQVMIAVVVSFLSLLIVGEDPYVMLVTAFVVGMFPMQLLTPVMEGVRRRLGMDTPKELPLTLINGVDSTLESLLQEENIDSVQILATSDISDIHRRTAIPVSTLFNWQRQALLFDVLGTQELIHRFGRIGINDFDDLMVLVSTMDGLPIDSVAFRDDFTKAMRIKADDEAINSDEFWRVLVHVLIREYKSGTTDSVIEFRESVETDTTETESIPLEVS